MKIAFVSTILGYPWGGADTLWTHAAETAAQRGDSILLAVSPLAAAHPRIQHLLRGGARWHQRSVPATFSSFAERMRRRLTRQLRRTDPLFDALAAFGPELVIVSCGGTSDLLLEPALLDWLRGRRCPFRVICNWQQENPVLAAPDKPALSRIFSEAKDVVFVSTRNLAVTRRLLLDPLPNARVFQNPIREPSERRPLPWPQTPELRFATVARLSAEKGLALLLHSLAAALDRETGWRLDLFGEGPDRASLQATIDFLGLGERVRLAGQLNDLEKIWSDHHLLVSPAIEEGVPMTIPEAMLRGRAVLATCVGGAEDWIAHGQNGFLCPAPTVPLLAAALREAWVRRGDWPELGVAAAASARARYRPDDFQRLLLP